MSDVVAVTYRYPDTNYVYAEGYINKDGQMDGEFKIYANSSSKSLIRELVIADGVVVSSKITLNGRVHHIDYPDNNYSYSISSGNNVIQTILGLVNKSSGFKSLRYDEGSITIYGSTLSITSKINNNGDNGVTTVLGTVEFKDKNGYKILYKHKDTIPGGALEIVLHDNNGREISRKIFGGNRNSSKELSLKNTNGSELIGIFPSDISDPITKEN